MMSADQVDEVLNQIEENPHDLSEFYDELSENYPMAFSWLTTESAPLTEEEHDYFLFLGMVVMKMAISRDADDCLPTDLEASEEAIWTILNDDMPHSLEVQAENVEDEDGAVIFLIDSLHANDDLPFLTPPGAMAMYARLYALTRALGLSVH